MWARIKKFFKDSETIFYARLQYFLGIVAMIVTYVDPSVLEPIFPNGYFPVFLTFSGIMTEYLRRRRDEDM